MSSAISSAVLMCHAPIVIPQVAGARAVECERTTQGMQKAAQALVASKPDVLIVLSPHTPRDSEQFGIIEGAALTGNLAMFGFDQIQIELPNALQVQAQINEADFDQKLLPLGTIPLDHGAVVPLYFVTQAGWKGPTAVISFPYTPTHSQCQNLGKALAKAAAGSDKRWAILASGDMSHRLIEGAPAGFHPQAKQFDAWVSQHVSKGDYQTAIQVDESLRDLAAEDVIDSLEIASAAIDHQARQSEVFSYEGPFGVGYLTAKLYGR